MTSNRTPVRALIAQHSPGVSVKALCAQAGSTVRESTLRHWTNPGARPKHRPDVELVVGLADLLGCSVGEAEHAFNVMMDPQARLPVNVEELPERERRLLVAFRGLTDTYDQERAIAQLEVLAAIQRDR